jgi:hypothetical protein
MTKTVMLLSLSIEKMMGYKAQFLEQISIILRQ